MKWLEFLEKLMSGFLGFSIAMVLVHHGGIVTWDTGVVIVAWTGIATVGGAWLGATIAVRGATSAALEQAERIELYRQQAASREAAEQRQWACAALIPIYRIFLTLSTALQSRDAVSLRRAANQILALEKALLHTQEIYTDIAVRHSFKAISTMAELIVKTMTAEILEKELLEHAGLTQLDNQLRFLLPSLYQLMQLLDPAALSKAQLQPPDIS